MHHRCIKITYNSLEKYLKSYFISQIYIYIYLNKACRKQFIACIFDELFGRWSHNAYSGLLIERQHVPHSSLKRPWPLALVTME